MLYKTMPACSPDVEALVTKTIGCAIRVHRTIGPGYNEGIYQDALAIDLGLEGIPFNTEVTIHLTYRGQLLRPHRLDLVVDRVGLLMNFNSEWLKGSIRRFVL